MRNVLSAALSRAVREELLTRNVARHAEVPTAHARKLKPWSVAEARGFLAAAREDPLLLHLPATPDGKRGHVPIRDVASDLGWS